MNPPSKRKPPKPSLRATAEARLAQHPVTATALQGAEQLLHELQVHQVELEMQNEALRHAQTALEESRDRFVDFYEFAPVGYATLTDQGAIADINLTGAALLGLARGKLLHRAFSRFVVPEDTDRWYQHFSSVLKCDDKMDCELALRRQDEVRLHARLDSLRLLKAGQAPTVRVVLSDVTARKQAEQQLLDMAAGLEKQVSERTRQLSATAAKLTQVEELERIKLAQELHDGLLQLLFIIKIKLSMLVPGAPQSSVNPIVQLVDQAERAARTTLRQLHFPVLQTLGLLPALESLAEEMQRTHNLTVHFEREGEPKPLVEEVQTILFRAARELLINVAKHAKASYAVVCCRCDERGLVLVVKDDGCGLDSAQALDVGTEEAHFGLRSIYERMTNMGGGMEIDSTPGSGTTITLTVPDSAAAKECQTS